MTLTRGCGISTDWLLLLHIVGRALKQPAHQARTLFGRTHKFDPGAPSLTRPKAWSTASAQWTRQVQQDKAASRYCDAHRRDDLICSECCCCAMLCRSVWHNCLRWLDGARKAILDMCISYKTGDRNSCDICLESACAPFIKHLPLFLHSSPAVQLLRSSALVHDVSAGCKA